MLIPASSLSREVKANRPRTARRAMRPSRPGARGVGVAVVFADRGARLYALDSVQHRRIRSMTRPNLSDRGLILVDAASGFARSALRWQAPEMPENC
jgi:hypothetical protein